MSEEWPWVHVAELGGHTGEGEEKATEVNRSQVTKLGCQVKDEER